MLDTTIKSQLRTYLERLRQPIELVASLGEDGRSLEMRDLLREIAELSPLVSVREDGADARKPSFAVTRPGEPARVHFAGIPMGHEFTSLVLALLQVGGYPPKVDAATIEQIRAIRGNFRFETYISLSCHNCPDVVQALNLMAVLNPGVESVMIDGALFQAEPGQTVMPVVRNGQLVGLVTAENIGELMMIRAARRERGAEPPPLPGAAPTSFTTQHHHHLND